MGILESEDWGAGSPVVLVHGCLIDGPSTWSKQRPVAESGRWRLVVLQRRGYGTSPPSQGDDFVTDSTDVADALTEPAHVAAHSYGAIAALSLAGADPTKVRSLIVVEPPAYTAADDDPEVNRVVTEFEDWWEHAPSDPATFLDGWSQRSGIRVRLPDPIPTHLQARIELLRRCRRPWTAVLRWDVLRAASFPKLVVSGGHSSVIELICDRLAARIGAERVVIEGRGHLVPQAGRPFNSALEDVLLAAEG